MLVDDEFERPKSLDGTGTGYKHVLGVRSHTSTARLVIAVTLEEISSEALTKSREPHFCISFLGSAARRRIRPARASHLVLIRAYSIVYT